MVRISRPCYDKWRRCPGWAGGGDKYAKEDRCDNGMLTGEHHEWTRWCWWVHIHHCPKCGVFVLPAAVRYIDPTNWVAVSRHKIAMWIYYRKS